MRRIAMITFVLAAGVLVGWCSSGLANRQASAAPRPVKPRGALLPAEQALTELFKEARQSVAYITSVAYQRELFSFDVEAVPTGTGSGFVWDTEGHVVTNFHVIEGAQELVVTLSDGSLHRASVVGMAPEKDLAVLQLREAPAAKLRPIPIGSSADLQVGQSVMAIGNPFGLDQTLTTGIVSALGREIQSATRRRITGVIQTDAAINPGNSGGPLLDSAGRLIGVNTAIQSTSGSSAGIGFAVPVDTVNRIVPQLIARGRALRPDLGFEALSRNMTGYFDNPEGIVVLRIRPGSAADKAGLRGITREGRRFVLGDVILSANGKAMREMDRLLDLADNEALGSSLKLEVLREGRKLSLALPLESAP